MSARARLGSVGLPDALRNPETSERTPHLAEYLGEIALALRASALTQDGMAHNPNDPWRSSTAAGIAVAADGKPCVIDAKADQVRVFAGDGARLQTRGERGTEPGQVRFTQPNYAWGDLAINPQGLLYIVDPFNSRFQVWDQDGSFLRAWGSRGSGVGQFDKPTGIGIDQAGQVYVTEFGNRRLQIFDSEGGFLAIWNPEKTGGGPFQGPTDIAIDASGVVAVTDTDRHAVYRFTTKGTVIDILGAPWGDPGFLSWPWGVATDARGQLYVATSRQIHVFDQNGVAMGVIAGVRTTNGRSPEAATTQISTHGRRIPGGSYVPYSTHIRHSYGGTPPHTPSCAAWAPCCNPGRGPSS